MIARTWHGKTKTIDAQAYRQIVIDTGIKELTTTKGNLGAEIWQRQEGDVTHIWVISWWANLESIKAFAGEEIEKPRYYDEDKKYLLEFEPNVLHYEAFNFKATK